jgi:uncharacterized protein YdbL (DUF1318 family)
MTVSTDAAQAAESGWKERLFMANRLGGRKSKDSVISDNFNTSKVYTKPRKRPTPPAPTAADQSPTAQLASVIGITAADIDAWGEDIQSSLTGAEEPPDSYEPTEDTREEDPPADAIKMTPMPTPTPISSTPAATAGSSGSAPRNEMEGDGEDRFAEDLMEDMRYVYKQLGGRTKLRALMTGDKEFIGLVKDLMKVEAAYLAKKLGLKGENQPQGFLVVLKGLEGDDKLVKDIRNNKAIDFKQIERAMNPTLERSKVESEIKLGLRPDEIMRKQ